MSSDTLSDVNKYVILIVFRLDKLHGKRKSILAFFLEVAISQIFPHIYGKNNELLINKLVINIYD
jgi:hypothetical protein